VKVEIPFMSPPPTALSSALARVGDRWSLVIVEALTAGPLRFADLRDAIDGISTNVLSARLRHLEAERVLLAVPYSERPLRYTYELTDAGRDLGGAVRLLSQWSADHAGPAGAGPARPGSDEPRPAGGAPRHRLCGTPMVAVWWCPTCEQQGGSDEPETVWA
jgi:DNA-binding HxlR family transcriptional regulator